MHQKEPPSMAVTESPVQFWLGETTSRAISQNAIPSMQMRVLLWYQGVANSVCSHYYVLRYLGGTEPWFFCFGDGLWTRLALGTHYLLGLSMMTFFSDPTPPQCNNLPKRTICRHWLDALFVSRCPERKHHLEIELLNPRRNKFDKKVKNAEVKRKKEMLINGPRATQKPYRHSHDQTFFSDSTNLPSCWKSLTFRGFWCVCPDSFYFLQHGTRTVSNTGQESRAWGLLSITAVSKFKSSYSSLLCIQRKHWPGAMYHRLTDLSIPSRLLGSPLRRKCGSLTGTSLWQGEHIFVPKILSEKQIIYSG